METLGERKILGKRNRAKFANITPNSFAIQQHPCRVSADPIDFDPEEVLRTVEVVQNLNIDPVLKALFCRLRRIGPVSKSRSRPTHPGNRVAATGASEKCNGLSESQTGQSPDSPKPPVPPKALPALRYENQVLKALLVSQPWTIVANGHPLLARVDGYLDLTFNSTFLP